MLDFRDAPGLEMRGGHLARPRGTAAMRASKQLVDDGFDVGDPESLVRGMTISQRIGLSPVCTASMSCVSGEQR